MPNAKMLEKRDSDEGEVAKCEGLMWATERGPTVKFSRGREMVRI